MKLSICSVIAAAAVSVSGLQAATYSVTTTSDFNPPEVGSLRWAVEECNAPLEVGQPFVLFRLPFCISFDGIELVICS